MFPRGPECDKRTSWPWGAHRLINSMRCFKGKSRTQLSHQKKVPHDIYMHSHTHIYTCAFMCIICHMVSIKILSAKQNYYENSMPVRTKPTLRQEDLGKKWSWQENWQITENFTNLLGALEKKTHKESGEAKYLVCQNEIVRR